MRHLFEEWQTIGPRVRSAGSVALFVDFDGTLTPTVDSPAAAELPPQTRRILRRLAHHPSIHLNLVSGRSQQDLRSRVGLPGLNYLGSHGFGDQVLPEGQRRKLRQARRDFAKNLNPDSRLRIEEKEATFAIHYRGANLDDIHEGQAALDGVRETYPDLQVLQGDMVWDVLPREVTGKGVVARKRWRALRKPVLAIYIGNDETDEPAFRALTGGITVKVGPARWTRARYRLRTPTEVRHFLERLEKEVP